jgi:hypothetical protein
LVGCWYWLPFLLLEQQPLVAVSAASHEVGLIPFRIFAVEVLDFALCEDEWFYLSGF